MAHSLQDDDWVDRRMGSQWPDPGKYGCTMAVIPELKAVFRRMGEQDDW